MLATNITVTRAATARIFIVGLTGYLLVLRTTSAIFVLTIADRTT
jgi:hypothetical protein